MASQFQQESLKIVVAQICQVIGFQGINSTPLAVMIDLLHRYIKEMAISTHRYSEHAGRTTPNLDDLSLTFKEMGISLSELEEYVTNVEPTPYPYEVPKVPVAKQSNLNFLKPGAREIVSRPLCIHEHLPPMYPEKEEQDVNMNTHPDGLENEIENCSEAKSPVSPSHIKRNFNDGEMSPNKKFKLSYEEEGEPVREIDSVMMTTSGFISSAREGKYPEARRPNIPLALPRSNSPTSHKIASVVKKKATMEKIIRHKNHQIGIIPGSLSNSKSKEFKIKPKIPSAPPGTGSLKYSKPGGIPPKLKIPVPNLPTPKVLDSGIIIGDKVASLSKDSLEKKKRRERDRERRKEKNKDGKKDKKDERPKKERNRDEKKKRDKPHHTKLKNERTRIRMKGLTKEEELRRYKERENELIAALAASSAVTVTSIPPPSLRVREKSPEKNPEKTLTSPQDSKSKLSIFKKVNKSKDGDKYRSRENSPKLMIDDIVKEEPKSPPPSPTIDSTYEEPILNSPLGTPSTPKTPDILPSIKNKRGRPHKIKLEDGTYLSPLKKSPKTKKTSSPRGRKRGGGIFSPSWRHPMGEITPDRPNLHQSILDRPKTPEGVLSQEDIACPSSFSIPSFPNAPGFIPPFSRFTFGPFGTPPLVPPVLVPPIPDSPINALSRVFINSFSDNKAEDIVENRPLTPSHEGVLSSHTVTEKDNLFQANLSPLPEAPKLQSKEASTHPTNKPEKLSKLEKEKKKEHKKEKKEKEKLRKKKEKKEKEKAKEEKKREKERLKLEKKEKRKRGRKRSDTSSSKDSSVPKITFKLPTDGGVVTSSSSLPAAEHKPTPKLVIKPVVKHPNEDSKMLLSLECKKRHQSASPPLVSSPRLPSIKLPPQDEPGSPPEIAKFSPLITRPPKLKVRSKKNSSDILTVPPLKIKDPSSLKISKNDLTLSSKLYKESHKDHKDSHRDHKEYKDQQRDYKELIKDYKELHKDNKDSHKEYKELNKEHKEPLKEYKEPHKDHKEHIKEYKEPHKEYKEIYKDYKEPHKEFPKDLIISHIPATVPPLKIRNAPPAKGYEDKKFPSVKNTEKKVKKKKSPSRETPPPLDNTTIKITSILPSQPPSCATVPEHIKPRLSTPTPKGSRNSSVNVPTGGPVSATPQAAAGSSNSKISASGLVTETVGPIGHFVDDQGNEVWICPTCGKQDDGSPMIGCDTCDDWYHWLCVGIHVPPSERENWYCPRCLSQHKQKGLGLIEKKKRGRKRKFPAPV